MAEKRTRRTRKAGDGLEADFGPGFDPAAQGPSRAGESRGAGPAESRGEAGFAGFGAGIPCGKDGCFLKPLGDLVNRFALGLASRGHAESAARAATSGIELLRALRDFLDEEIAFAERAAEARRGKERYTKIPVE
ncbi:MAG: hypothetical protein KJ062_08600 [Thermoanaerobaculia bacterium]|nr:hypothetical protein [Thermoanaerobaculia bacterium]